MRGASPTEVMTIVAAREISDGQVLLVGVGPPNVAANLARRLHAPECVLVYESGALDARPSRLPLSIGDEELASSALTVVSVPELFSYWIGGGRIDVGFLGAAQIDRFANINTTVIGDYGNPEVRLPGAGGAPEIAGFAKQTLVLANHTRRCFVERVDFVTSVGHPRDNGRAALGLEGAGPRRVVTDLGILDYDEPSGELELSALHPGVNLETVRAATGWPLRARPHLQHTTPPSDLELHTLRELRAGR